VQPFDFEPILVTCYRIALRMRIAIDTGGTFTDCVFVRDGVLEILKVPSTPRRPADAIGAALKKILVGAQHAAPLQREKRSTDGGAEALDLTCGTTVGTNALLERRGGRIALITTAGFEDVLEIGRQARPRLYDFFVERPAPLVPRERRYGLRERVAADGIVLRRPSRAELRRIVRMAERDGAGSVAVCLLFSFANPAHERAVARALRSRGFEVSVSHEILPEFREFERTATTVVNAYLVPVVSQYLAEISGHASNAGGAKPKRSAARAQVRIMQSSGGIISAGVASREPVRTILSGPAGGILGAQYVAELAGFDRIISFDMGGTSTDVALVEGALRTTNESQVAELPVAVPMLDIHTVGAGGGSLARFDRAGALRVGPESAGADPGPICYGRGEQPTVTDAHLVLGRIATEGFLGGEFLLDERRARYWMERLRGPMRSVEVFAQGIVDVANAVMEKAIRLISIERGYDPRDYALVAFGGAGGLHACDLAAALEMPEVLVPKFPGALSALGILRADVVRDFSQTVRVPVDGVRGVRSALEQNFRRLERRGAHEMRAEAFKSRQIRIERWLDMRYVGQAYELGIPAAGDFVESFHRAHERRYGYADPQRPTEIVNVRAKLIGATPKPELPRQRSGAANAANAVVDRRRTVFARRARTTLVYDRAKLRAGHRFAGPAIVTEYSATTVVPPGWRAFVDAFGNLLLEPR
jgi:N-methylhydantoinase A